MCGIVGFINCGNKKELDLAVKSINHRGPDVQKSVWFQTKNCGLGHTRLKIIDLSDYSNQPMFDKYSNNWIVYNGEIYNYIEIRSELRNIGWNFITSSDTEVVLKAYIQWGKDAISKFNGMFSFAIFNEKSKEVFLCRDRLGIKPIYYYHENEKLIFASEIKSILKCSDYQKEPDYYSLFTPVHFQASPYTGFKNILKLEAGHILTFKDGFININKYWDIIPCENIVSFNDAFEELDYLLNDSIKRQMVSDVPIGSLLSGGLDSSIISVLMQKYLNQSLNTFTIKFKKEDLKRQGNVDDSHYAKILAEQYGFNHHEILIEPDIANLLSKLIWHLDEPISDPASINSYLISKEANKKGIKVLLSGMGADEVFGGYRYYLACLKADYYQKFPSFFRSQLEHFVEKLKNKNINKDNKYIRWIKVFLNVASLPELDRALQIKNSALSPHSFNDFFINEYSYYNTIYYNREKSIFNMYPQLTYLTKLCLCDSKTYLTDHNLTYSDKSIMAASVEGRPPLIDHRIVELMFKLPSKYRIKGNIQKYLLKKVAEKYLPKQIIYRPKAPFSAPLRGWLKNELSEMVQDILSYQSLKNRGIYNPKYVQKIIVENNQGFKDNSQLLWRLMVNELWFRTFFD